METVLPLAPFQPHPPDAAGVVTWAHIGDLHMTLRGEQNHRDLIAIVERLNRSFATALSFVFLPGDVADHGSPAEYALVREALAPLQAPWCCIVGDHDVHQKTFAPFVAAMAPDTRFSFTVGCVRFIALNAFDIPDPGSFCLLPDQLAWLASELQTARSHSQSVVLLLHCYPTDLKQGGDALRKLVDDPIVRLIAMGHTHYNEVANDGRTLYTATRSTGQIEEGEAGFSVTNIDGDVVSWKFFSPGPQPSVMITSPADERFITDAALGGHIAMSQMAKDQMATDQMAKDQMVTDQLIIRAKVWSEDAIDRVTAEFASRKVTLQRIPGSAVWQAACARGELPDGLYPLTVRATTADGNAAEDTIRMVIGVAAFQQKERAARDQDNALDAWPERGLLGTQLGPNKNGRKW